VKSGLGELQKLARVSFGRSRIENALAPSVGNIFAKMPGESLVGFARKADRRVLRQPGFGLIFVGERSDRLLINLRVASNERGRPSAASEAHSPLLTGLSFGGNVCPEAPKVRSARSPAPDHRYPALFHQPPIKRGAAVEEPLRTPVRDEQAIQFINFRPHWLFTMCLSTPYHKIDNSSSNAFIVYWKQLN
jgi:hypothetical protein